VEQNVEASLSPSDYAFILHEGRIKAEGSAGKIRRSRDIRAAYLGI
jgi:ABC-type branched-subunit amino acid transport system ATPase component